MTISGREQQTQDAPASLEPPLFKAARAGSMIGLATVLSLTIGFFLQLAIAFRFGASGDTDAFFMAQGTSELLAKILLGGSLTSVFLPIFVEHITHGRPEQAWKLANHLFHLASAAFLVILVLMGMFTHPLVSAIAPGFSAHAHDTTVLLLRIMLPGFFFLMLADLATATLHSFRIFGVPALARLFTPVISLLLVLTAGRTWGIVVLALGTLAGATLQILLIIGALARNGFRYEPVFSLRDPDVRRTLRLVLPFILSVLAAQASGVVYRVLVSHFPEGSLSALKFGEKVFQITNVLFFSSITTVAFPAFSRAVASRAWNEVRTTLRSATRLMLFFGLPLTIGIFLLREPLVRLLYERGSFTPEDTAATAAVLGILLFGLVTNAVSSLLGHLALALKETRLSVNVTIATQGATMLLFLALAPRLGIRGLALGSAISPVIPMVLFAFLLRRFLPRLRKADWSADVLRVAIPSAALTVAVIVGKRLTASMGTAPDAVTLAVSALLGSAVYLATSWALKIPELSAVRNILYYVFTKNSA
jgi:putative peptidoglycan lipid II flippase